jgi:outer membrane protein TolC
MRMSRSNHLTLALYLFSWGWAHGQSSTNSINTPRPFDPGQNSTNPSSFAVQTQNPFLGSIPLRPLTPGTLNLSLREAVALALRANLGYVEAEQEHIETRAARLRALSQLLPQVDVDSTETYRNLVADSLGVPKLGLPNTIGAYNYQTAHVNYHQNLLDLSALRNLKAANRELDASEAAQLDARNVVVLAAVSSYLLTAASQTRLETSEAELKTAQAVDALVANRLEHELSPAIDNTRTQVALLSVQLRVKIARTTLAKDKLALTRIIGLPVEQEFLLTDGLEYHACPVSSDLERMRIAEERRQDIRAAGARVAAAEQAERAASDERLPTLDVRANAGETAFTYGSAHPDYEVEGRVSIPIFTGLRIESETKERRALLARRRAELEDVTERAKYEIRTALLDLDAAETSVEVSNKNYELANDGLVQAQRRFDAGVSNVVEFLQAQQAVAEAQDNRIASLYAHQLAKLFLIRAMGTAEQDYISYVGVR